jgi:VWFA-related protein
MATRHVHLGVLSAAVMLGALRVAGLAQSLSPQSPPPTFRSTVDLLTIDASVRDKRGEVIPDLQASDFTVTIDGRPRQVVSAVFYKADPAARTRRTGGASPTPRYVSNEGAQPGRVVVFALDPETITKGQERPFLETASRMLDGLSAADAVGLIELPGRFIEATRDHASVAKALAGFTGRAPTEAEIKAQGPNWPLTQRAHTQQVLLDLSSLLRRMSAVRAPRSVILISGGLIHETDFMYPYAELQRAAAESRVTLYTVLLENVGYEVERGETRPDVAAADPGKPFSPNSAAAAPVRPVTSNKSDGLSSIASRTGGMFFSGVGTAVGVFDRIESEVTSFYQLGLESSPADADGKSHDVKVKVNREGLDIRTPSHVAVARPATSGKPAARDPLALALQQPIDLPDVPIAVTTYSTHPSGEGVRLLISAEIGAADGAAPAEWGVAVNQNGKNVVTRRGRIPAGSERPWFFSTTVEVPPGEYRLRVAAADVEDRIGALETAATAGFQTTGSTVAGDLIVGVATGRQLEPRRRIARSEEMIAILDVRPGSGAVLGGTLQLIPRAAAPVPSSTRR